MYASLKNAFVNYGYLEKHEVKHEVTSNRKVQFFFSFFREYVYIYETFAFLSFLFVATKN